MKFCIIFSVALPFSMVGIDLAMDLPQRSGPLGFRKSNSCWETDHLVYWVDEESGICPSRDMGTSENSLQNGLSHLMVHQGDSPKAMDIALCGQPVEQSTGNFERNLIGQEMSSVFQEAISLGEVNNIPTVISSQVECPICLSYMDDDDTNIHVWEPCKHKHHQICIENWLRTKITCPVCRAVDSRLSAHTPDARPIQPMNITDFLTMITFISVVVAFLIWFNYEVHSHAPTFTSPHQRLL
ncbi:hypothetical protein PGT21_026948 [Puccinia graminis f. sp. tritici]|uniref:RING-type domain-containing protein n=1 Tax=Puccinia graminis f. sp. tritici TaxID=56615 RepID=A0A5B0RQY1_PUCGR|nr:hypothetical protein PGT21_026948 [Puccinia graminis f. sp. tritici]KAA1127084.1 hypothetical protein PGTUg99_019448 [Puccinia graminis f. sp. tritici]